MTYPTRPRAVHKTEYELRGVNPKQQYTRFVFVSLLAFLFFFPFLRFLYPFAGLFCFVPHTNSSFPVHAVTRLFMYVSKLRTLECVVPTLSDRMQSFNRSVDQFVARPLLRILPTPTQNLAPLQPPIPTQFVFYLIPSIWDIGYPYVVIACLISSRERLCTSIDVKNNKNRRRCNSKAS